VLAVKASVATRVADAPSGLIGGSLGV
jgi:hypothetical protein